MKKFNSFLSEAENKIWTPNPTAVSDDVVETFGRHNPPHLGHGKTFDFAKKLAGNIGDKSQADARFYTSQSQDPKKNPLPQKLKLQHLKKMFPQHAENFDADPNVRTILQAAQKAHSKGYKNFHFVGGADRKQGMEDLLRKYNGQLYNFDNIYSHSAGDREEDNGDLISSLSASKMRNFAQKGDIGSFLQGLPIGENYTKEDAQELFNELRSFMDVSEEWQINSRDHQEYIREQYKAGRLLQHGDLVESLVNGLVGNIHRCGTNHVICVTEDGVMFKSFIHDVHLI